MASFLWRQGQKETCPDPGQLSEFRAQSWKVKEQEAPGDLREKVMVLLECRQLHLREPLRRRGRCPGSGLWPEGR